MILAIVGSRGFSDYALLVKTLARVHSTIDCIVSGGAKGADSLAERYAWTRDIPTEIYLPDWRKHGKSAGFRRNQLIVDAADALIAFQIDRSKGTQHSIDLANKKGIPVYVVHITKESFNG